MRPTLEPGDVLVVCRRAVRCGDLVVIEPRQGRPAMVKRVVDIGADGLWVERDNPQVGVDSWVFGAVPPSAVAGVVRWVVRPPRWGRRR